MKKLHELFVPYGLALKLKEKGFNEPCFMHYHEDFCKGELFNGMENPYSNQIHTIKNSDGELIGAPIYQQVIDWFIQKHKIQLKVIAFDTEGKVKWYYECQSLELVKSEHSKTKVFRFKVPKPNISNTHYKALYKAVKEALKLI